MRAYDCPDEKIIVRVGPFGPEVEAHRKGAVVVRNLTQNNYDLFRHDCYYSRLNIEDSHEWLAEECRRVVRSAFAYGSRYYAQGRIHCKPPTSYDGST